MVMTDATLTSTNVKALIRFAQLCQGMECITDALRA